MQYIILLIEIKDDDTIKSVSFEENTTRHESGLKLLKGIGNAILKGTDQLIVQDEIVQSAKEIINEKGE